MDSTRIIDMDIINNYIDESERLFSLLENPESIDIKKGFKNPRRTEAEAKENYSEAYIERIRKLENPNTLYVYDVDQRKLHDKSCKLIKDIKDEKLEVLHEFDIHMKSCKYCRLKAIARYRVDDPQDINRAVAFLKNINAEITDLYGLFIHRDAQIRYVSDRKMQIHLDEDTWEIEHGFSDLYNKLWHNNYHIEDGYRIMEDEFHPHKSVLPSFRAMAKAIINYDNQYHVKKQLDLEKEYLEMAPENDIGIEKENHFNQNTVVRINKFSLIFDEYIFIDSVERCADQIFRKYKIRHKTIAERVCKGSNYIIVACKIPKWHRKKMFKVFTRIKAKMYKNHHSRGYLCCESLMETLTKHGIRFTAWL